MSEFSESYHLRSERSEDAVELLRRAGLKGYVFEPANGWVTFVAEGGVFEPNEQIIEAARHPLLHYVSCEDHGWSFDLFVQGENICGYGCGWDDDITVNDSKYSRAALQRLIPIVEPGLFDDWETRLHPEDFDALFEAEPSKLFAQAIGLEHYEWTSYDYVDSNFQSSSSDFPKVIAVT